MRLIAKVNLLRCESLETQNVMMRRVERFFPRKVCQKQLEKILIQRCCATNWRKNTQNEHFVCLIYEWSVNTNVYGFNYGSTSRCLFGSSRAKCSERTKRRKKTKQHRIMAPRNLCGSQKLRRNFHPKFLASWGSFDLLGGHETKHFFWRVDKYKTKVPRIWIIKLSEMKYWLSPLYDWFWVSI